MLFALYSNLCFLYMASIIIDYIETILLELSNHLETTCVCSVISFHIVTAEPHNCNVSELIFFCNYGNLLPASKIETDENPQREPPVASPYMYHPNNAGSKASPTDAWIFLGSFRPCLRNPAGAPSYSIPCLTPTFLFPCSRVVAYQPYRIAPCFLRYLPT